MIALFLFIYLSMKIEKIRRSKQSNYETLCVHAARDKKLSLKAKGFMYVVFSLKDDWDFSVSGMAAILLEGNAAIRSTINELRAAGYVKLKRETDERGRVLCWYYSFDEFPSFLPDVENPHLDNPDVDNPDVDNPTQSNTNKINNRKNQKKENKSTAPRNGGAGNAGAETPPKTERAEPKTHRAAAREIIAYLCFGFPPGKLKFLSAKQKTKIQSAIRDIEIFSDNKVFPALNYFGSFWANDWRSFDKKFGKFQRPRPEQFGELWFEFIESDALTKKQADAVKQSEPDAPDYSDFNEMEF